MTSNSNLLGQSLSFEVPRYATAAVKIPAAELRALLGRALNTMEPCNYPVWADQILGGSSDGRGGLLEGLLNTDECILHVTRQVQSTSL